MSRRGITPYRRTSTPNPTVSGIRTATRYEVVLYDLFAVFYEACMMTSSVHSFSKQNRTQFLSEHAVSKLRFYLDIISRLQISDSSKDRKSRLAIILRRPRRTCSPDPGFSVAEQAKWAGRRGRNHLGPRQDLSTVYVRCCYFNRKQANNGNGLFILVPMLLG
jgi:hypothetical protein